MYGVAAYGSMVADTVRMCAYEQALQRVITPGCVVLDIGTGIGVTAMLACRLGAGQVFAVEPDDVIQVAKGLAERNGCADRIKFFQDLSTNITLPRPADVIVSDLRGVLPFFQQHVPSIIDARQRHLASGGVLIPARDTIWTTLVEAPVLYAEYLTPWTTSPFDLDLASALPLVTSTWCKARIRTEQCLSEPQTFARLDYAEIDQPNVDRNLEWIVQRSGTVHALCVWFDAVLCEGIGFSNAPGEPEAIYGNAFFPLSSPVAVSEGDVVRLTLRAHLMGDDYVWIWNTTVYESGNPDLIKAAFRQSTLQGVPLNMGQLRKQADTHVPVLGDEWAIDRYILNSMDGSCSVGEIATHLAERFPTRFNSWHDALSRVGALSRQYSQ